jgi:alkylation response protein AidB-like acyl-CoA dehydrogenase
MTVLRQWLSDGTLDLPLPGHGQTAHRWRRLADLAQIDLVAGRLAEAHTDAVAILAELDGPRPKPDQLWAVWAAESADAPVTARSGEHDEVLLSGTKTWCSGAGLCSNALVTARVGARRGLFAVDLSHHRVRRLPSTWHTSGMAESDTRSVEFADAPAIPVGRPDAYLSRPGFWHGAVGVSACWLGGARAVAAPLYRRAAGDTADPHALAHLGAVDAALAAAEAVLDATGARVDADPANRSGDAELLARRARAVVEDAVAQTLDRVGRALGPAPLCLDAEHAQRVADLTVYVRQSHAERDLERLGMLAGHR